MDELSGLPDLDVDTLSSLNWAMDVDAMGMEMDASDFEPSPRAGHQLHESLGGAVCVSCPPLRLLDTSAYAADGVSSAVDALSQLLARLPSLHRASSALAEAANMPQATGAGVAAGTCGHTGHATAHLVVNDAAFRPVSDWLAHMARAPHHGPPPHPPHDAFATTAGTLHETFYASHCFLTILGRLGADAAPGTLTPCSNPGGEADLWAATPQASLVPEPHLAYFDLPVSATTPLFLHSNTVVRHLVGACHSLLLNIFIGPLDAMQHDARLSRCSERASLASQASQASQRGAHVPFPDATSLAYLRLVMMVQLFSHVIRRLQRAVAPFSSIQPDQDSLNDLNDQVWKRFTHLHRTLHI